MYLGSVNRHLVMNFYFLKKMSNTDFPSTSVVENTFQKQDTLFGLTVFRVKGVRNIDFVSFYIRSSLKSDEVSGAS